MCFVNAKTVLINRLNFSNRKFRLVIRLMVSELYFNVSVREKKCQLIGKVLVET